MFRFGLLFIPNPHRRRRRGSNATTLWTRPTLLKSELNIYSWTNVDLRLQQHAHINLTCYLEISFLAAFQSKIGRNLGGNFCCDKIRLIRISAVFLVQPDFFL